MANNDFLNQFSNENYKKENKPIKEEMPNHFSSTQVKTGTVKKPEVKPMEKSIKVEPQNTLKSEQTIKDNKPDSFKEEKRVKVQKEPINPLLIIIPSIVALIIAAVLIYIFVFPHIAVPNFVGSSKEDVSAWIKQQQIETQGIILKEEYNFDAPIGQVLSQIPETGKVKKNAKMTFVVSKGADPDETVFVPELEQMSKAEIESWIKENKLSNTKISTAYNDEVEDGKVISTSYANGYDSSNFTRGTQLKISISKGPKPADQVTVENFVKSDYSAVEAWAEKNKIKLTKTERYSDTIPLGSVISQSLEANKKLNQGDSFSVVVSKGKGILVPSFGTMTSSQIDEWIEENKTYVKIVEKYANSNEYILEQSVKSGNYIGADNTITLTINLGNGFYLGDVYPQYNSGSYDKFKEWADSRSNSLGLTIDTHRIYTESSMPKGTIIGIESIKSGSNVYSEIEKLPLSVDVYVYVSNGEISSEVDFEEMFALKKEDVLTGGTYKEIVNWCKDIGADVSGIKTADGSEIHSSEEDIFKVERFEIKDIYGNIKEYKPSAEKDTDIPKGATLILKKIIKE